MPLQAPAPETGVYSIPPRVHIIRTDGLEPITAGSLNPMSPANWTTCAYYDVFSFDKPHNRSKLSRNILFSPYQISCRMAESNSRYRVTKPTFYH